LAEEPLAPPAPRPRRRLSRPRLLAIARKEVLQLRRDTRSLAMGFVLPVLLLIIFGYAITFDVSHVATAVVDDDHTASSRALIDAFRSSGYFDFVAYPPRRAEIATLLDRNRVLCAIVVPARFGADLGAGRVATVQVIVDGSDANTATIVLGYAQAIVRQHAQSLQAASRRTPPVVAITRVWYNETLESRNMIVPGLVAVIMAIIAAMLTSLTLAREWERGTMEQLIATPVSRAEVVIGKLLPYLGIGFVDVVVATVLGILLYGVPFRGDAVLLFAASLVFLIGASATGIFISAVARSQLLATQMAMLLTFLPSYLLSGFMFAISVMPAPLQALSAVMPARYFLTVTRGVFLKGVGLDVLWPSVLVMIAFSAVSVALAMRAFRKELV
jgi:ABC-2 type transport system permease protein